MSVISFAIIFLIFIFENLIYFAFGNPVSTIHLQRNTSLSDCLTNPNTTEICKAMLPYVKASNIIALMDENIDPCEDFYSFSCGKWSRINPAREVPSTGFFEDLSQALTLKISHILNSPTDPKENKNDQKVKNFYASCVKLNSNQFSEYVSNLKAIIGEFGTMPAIKGENWNPNNFDWFETIAKIKHKYGISIIIDADIMADFKENTINRIYVGQAELVLESKSIYLDETNKDILDYRTQYAKKIANQISLYLGVNKQEANTVAVNIVDFERKLARGMLDDKISLSLDEAAKLITPFDMTQKYGSTFNISKYLQIAFGEPIYDEIYEYNENFQKNLETVIKTTPKKILANYIFYKLIWNFFPKVAKDKKTQIKVCDEIVKEHFSKFLDNMIYRRYHSETIENEIKSIWDEIKKAFRKDLDSNKLSWISESVRQHAHRKLDKMKLEINSYINTDFDKEMGNLIMENDNFIENVKRIYENDMKEKISHLHEPPAPFEAGEQLAYTPANIILENTIKIPVALLQPYYLWNKAYPDAFMFGTLGYLVGHELVHGFDDNGREYDEVGNKREWWDESSTEAFNKRTECFINQYHQYEFNGKKLERSESQAENIADNGGIKIAYDAYLNWIKYNEDSIIPFRNYTSKQLFFISFAQIWCSDTHPRMATLQTSTDEHVPGKFRVIGVLSNYQEFSKEFNCKVGSYMNPVDKCEIY